MTQTTVLLAEDEPITRMDLRELLTGLGYSVVGEAADGWEAVQLCQRLRPTLVLMDIKMPKLDGLVAAQKIVDQRLAAVILLSAYSQKDLVLKAQRVGVSGYLTKPVRERELMPAIEIALARQERIEQLEREVQSAREDLAGRKLVEQAKGLLMRRYGWDEAVAYEKLRQLAMKRRQPLAEISRAVLAQTSAARTTTEESGAR